MHQLRLSVGAIVSAIHQTAQRAQPAVAQVLDRIRASPVVPPTKPAGARNRQWLRVAFQHPHRRYFLRRGRGKAVVDEACRRSGVLVRISTPPTTIMTAPSSAAGPTCRDIPDQRTRYPKDAALARSAVRSQSLQPSEPWQRRVAAARKLAILPVALSCLTVGCPGQACRRIERHIKELFVFVANQTLVISEPGAPGRFSWYRAR